MVANARVLICETCSRKRCYSVTELCQLLTSYMRCGVESATLVIFWAESKNDIAWLEFRKLGIYLMQDAPPYVISMLIIALTAC
jgi:hypothetical protein